jgi:hypothetical protein
VPDDIPERHAVNSELHTARQLQSFGTLAGTWETAYTIEYDGEPSAAACNGAPHEVVTADSSRELRERIRAD